MIMQEKDQLTTTILRVTSQRIGAINRSIAPNSNFSKLRLKGKARVFLEQEDKEEEESQSQS